MITATLFQSMLYVPLVLGIFLSFRILRLTDLTADGSFVLGGGIYARLTVANYPAFLSILLAIGGGFVVGLVLAFIQKNNRVPSIVASILCVFMMYSINLLVMGKPNISLLLHPTFFSTLMEQKELCAQLFILACVGGGVLCFAAIVTSKLGLIMRGFSTNYALMQQEGYKTELIRMLGLGVSNALYATSGVLVVNVNNFSDINMGFGIALTGIGAVIIGLQIFTTFGFLQQDRFGGYLEVIACLVGIFLYFLLINLLLQLDFNPNMIKLFVGLLLTLLFVIKLNIVANV